MLRKHHTPSLAISLLQRGTIRTPLASTLALLLTFGCTDTTPTAPSDGAAEAGVSARNGRGSGPRESQRLRGLGGRVFAVHVEELSPPGPGFDNCYSFLADGTFVDPLFFGPPGVPGTWTQHSVGAATTYTANADFEIPPTVTLVQEGRVTPARGRGILQLEANTTVFVDGQPVADFLSRGQEVDECPFTFPS